MRNHFLLSVSICLATFTFAHGSFANTQDVFSENFCTGSNIDFNEFFALFSPGTAEVKTGFFSTQTKTRQCAVYTGCSDWKLARPNTKVERSGTLYDLDRQGYFDIEFSHDERRNKLDLDFAFVAARYTEAQTPINSIRCRFSQTDTDGEISPSCINSNSIYINQQRMDFGSSTFKVKKRYYSRDDTCVWLKIKSVAPISGADRWNETEAVFYGRL